jgi:dipeptide/tripeptide permease
MKNRFLEIGSWTFLIFCVISIFFILTKEDKIFDYLSIICLIISIIFTWNVKTDKQKKESKKAEGKIKCRKT